MKSLLALLKHTLFLIYLTLAAITHSHAAMSPELASMLQNKYLTEVDKALINQSEELQALYQHLLIDRDLPAPPKIKANKINPSKIPATKDEYGFSDYKSAIIGKPRLGEDAVMIDEDGNIRHLRYRPQTQADIDFLSRFKKLNYLHLQSSSQHLKHVTLPNLSALKELRFDLSRTEKLDFGKTSIPLKAILIRGNRNLNTLANIKHLENLEHLTVFPSTLSDYTELEHNTSLKHLSLEATAEIQLPNFSNLLKLQYLSISAKDPISDISLKNCKNLVNASLSPINLEKIQLPPSIEKLNLYGNRKGEDLDKISHLKALQELSLEDISIKSLNDLPKIPQLKKLSLVYSEIKGLEGIEKFDKLRELAIYAGNLTATPNLAKLPNLNSLLIKNNKIEKIDHVKTWKNLEKVNLRDNKIIKIDGLRCLSSLKEMDLSGNPLREVSQADIDALLKKGFEGYINVTETEFGSDILYDEEFMKKHIFFEDPEYR